MNMNAPQLIVYALLTQGPELARALVAIFKVEQPTDAEWETVFAYHKKPYEQYIAEAKAALGKN